MVGWSRSGVVFGEWWLVGGMVPKRTIDDMTFLTDSVPLSVSTFSQMISRGSEAECVSMVFALWLRVSCDAAVAAAKL